MRRLRIFRGGEHIATVFREFRQAPSLDACLKTLDKDEVLDGDILSYCDTYWRVEHGEPRQLSPTDPRVQGLYGKAIRAEVRKRQTKPHFLGT